MSRVPAEGTEPLRNSIDHRPMETGRADIAARVYILDGTDSSRYGTTDQAAVKELASPLPPSSGLRRHAHTQQPLVFFIHRNGFSEVLLLLPRCSARKESVKDTRKTKGKLLEEAEQPPSSSFLVHRDFRAVSLKNIAVFSCPPEEAICGFLCASRSAARGQEGEEGGAEVRVRGGRGRICSCGRCFVLKRRRERRGGGSGGGKESSPSSCSVAAGL